MNIPNTRSDYIILSHNIINTNNIGTNLYIKTKIIDLSNYDISWQTTLSDLDTNLTTNLDINYKNRIILSGKINTSTSCCLITKNNIKNNMKFIFDSSNSNNGKILFVKNLAISDNSFNYLFDNLNSTYFENNNSNYINNSYTNSNINRYIYNVNYYFSRSDIYKINIRDYLYKYTDIIPSEGNNPNQDICYNKINYYINNYINNFSFINTTIDSSSIINFKYDNYSSLLIDNSNNNNFTTNNDNSLNILYKNTKYSIYRNILSYNKLTLDFKHVNYYDITITYNTTTNINLPNNIIKTFLIKTNNLEILQNIKKNSKIIFGSKNIYLNNIKVLDRNSPFYHVTRSINGISTTLKSIKDTSSIMFIAMGNQLTGITQHDIYNHTHFIYNSNNKLTIKIKKNINKKNIETNSKFTSLIPSLNNYYLLDISLNYVNNSIINNSYNINNTIQYNIILYNNVSLNIGKVFNLNFNSYFDASTNNYFKNSFNNLSTLNNIPSPPIYSISSELVNSSINIKFKNIIKPDEISFFNRIELLRDYIPKNSDNGYDFRFNYDKYFEVYHNLDIVLAVNSLNLKNNYYLDYYGYGYALLNFYSLSSYNLIKTSIGSDFNNVDCVYIYHDPINDPDPRFRYPNNNIETKFDDAIDTLTKAIEQYRGSGARTSTTNVAFIPAQNGSNLSRKMIQGIIGLNNIPKLLSISPYDPKSIIGRGFNNQYQITDECITSNCDKIEAKKNAIKHDSVKNNKIFASNSLKKQNFANIVKSNVLNNLSQECRNNSTTRNNVIFINNTASIQDPFCNKIKKYTPFVMLRKGKYL